MTGLHLVSSRRKGKPPRHYLYAWRGGPCIHVCDGERPTIGPELLARAMDARRQSGCEPNTLESAIRAYRASPEFQRLARSTRRDYRLWLERISESFGAAPLGAFDDRRMRGEIVAWRDRWADRPRTADKAAAMIATLLGWALERGLVGINVAAGIPQKGLTDEQIARIVGWTARRVGEIRARYVDEARVIVSLVERLSG